MVVALFLTRANHNRSPTSSSILLLFWPLYATGLLVWARTIISTDLPAFRYTLALKLAVGILGLGSFAFECLGSGFNDCEDEAADKLYLQNPILRANIFSIWSFGWMTGLMKKGASQYITEDDLPPLLPRDESTALGNDLQEAMAKQYVT